EPITQLTPCDELAFAASQRRRVDHEIHGQGRLVDAQHRQRFLHSGIHECAPYPDILDTVDQHDISGLRLIDQNALQTVKLQHLVDTTLELLPFWSKLDNNVLACPHLAAIDPAYADLADVAAVVQRNDLQLQRAIGVVLALRNIFKYGFEQRAHIAFAHIVGQARIACQPGGKNHREVELFFGGAKLVEQIESGIDDVIWPGARTVDFVHNHNGLQAQG